MHFLFSRRPQPTGTGPVVAATHRRQGRALGLGLGLLVGVLPLGAATQTVINTNDSGPGSLRQAIAQASAGDTIQFSLPNPSTITLTSGELLITKNLTLTGPGAEQLAVSGNHASRVFEIGAGATVTLSGLTIENGNDNSLFGGGGLLNNGALTVTNSTVSGNSARNINSGGGGLSNQGTLTVRDSTISGNLASDGGSLYDLGSGGGILNQGTLTLTNSTIAGNSAGTFGGQGGGLANFGGTLTLTNSTIAGNSAGGGIFNNYGGTLTVKSTLLAGNGDIGNCGFFAVNTSQGYNLSDDDTCTPVFTAPGDENNVGAGLDPKGLQNNGGPTPTIALLPTSPAVDHIPVANCTDTTGQPVTTDQRGITRPQGAGCDVGAFELVQTIPFSSFTAQLEVLTGKVSGFNLDARFTLGANSQGINPLTEAVTLTVGSYTVTLPPGSFHQVQIGPWSDYAYVGTVNQVLLDVLILPLGGSSYALQAAAVPVTLAGTTNSIPVTLTLGLDTGTTTVTPRIVRR